MSQISVNPLQTNTASLLNSINNRIDSWTNPSNKSVLPVATKVMAKTIEFDLVSTQPMSKPSGKLFYMDYEFEEPWICLDEHGNEVNDELW